MDPYLLAVAVAAGAVVAGCLIKNKIAKAVLSLASLPGFAVLAFFLAFGMSMEFGAKGEWLGLGITCAALVICMLFIWKPFTVKWRRLTAAAVGLVAIAVTAAFVGPELYDRSIDQVPEEVPLEQYAPFGLGPDAPETKVARLEEQSQLRLEGALPRLDGATALYPLYSAFVRATYPEAVYEPYAPLGDGPDETLVACFRTDEAFVNLIDGRADVAFLMGVSDQQRAMAAQAGLELTLTPIGREAFVFFVNADNSVANLASADVRRIYSGEVTNWKDVGGPNESIRAYQRPEESGSQVMLKQIMGGTPLAAAPEEDVMAFMGGMYRAVADYRNYRNSLGYSFLYYIRDMIGAGKIKFLSIDNVAPTRETIVSGQYPYALEFYAVTAKKDGAYLAGERGANTDKLLEWIKGPQGQWLVDETGYVSLR